MFLKLPPAKMRRHSHALSHELSKVLSLIAQFFRNVDMLIGKKRRLEFSTQRDWKIPAEPINEVQVLFCSEVELIISIMPRIGLAALSETLKKGGKKQMKESHLQDFILFNPVEERFLSFQKLFEQPLRFSRNHFPMYNCQLHPPPPPPLSPPDVVLDSPV